MLTEEELNNIVGGAAKISYSLINSVTKLLTTLLGLGRNVGSAIRYIASGKKC